MPPPSKVAPTGKVTTYTGPKTFSHRLIGGLILFYSVSYAAKGYIIPGTALYEALQKSWPGGAVHYLWLQEKIVIPVIAIHGVETAIMAYRLAGAGVGAGSGLWWKWIASCLIEGVGSHQRLSALIKGE
ncbi:hypothetical protein VC83_03749 [Pseudogymnoascus destructans]|uniref:Uncharacterized protein n=2 Tax=Pseudogymnoascus destructans TaxID=655981 RepID=L8G6V6_PSED2|nr:uncharacterized protein VC83_03749 [Pseudogymnoascus destructans]ELR07701.1 hypothetical protein GMDG_02723 [Pseudogymnoascus destructans 20631-21]OAF59685.1 hypothetical protein VC83_03749 [Pseudogymnoascus destructans]